MKRKYYLRGLGLGILVTSLVFIIAGPKEPTDEEVINRAEKLGYVKEENSSLGIKDLLNKETPVPTQPVEEQVTPVPTPTSAPVLTETPVPIPTEIPAATFTPTPIPTQAVEPTVEPTVTPTSTATPVPTYTPTPVPATPTPSPKPTSAPVEVVTAVIVVERGNTATVVCNKMAQAGIISDANKFRDYLVKQNLTDYINIGTYTMSSNMSFAEIAKLLTGR